MRRRGGEFSGSCPTRPKRVLGEHAGFAEKWESLPCNLRGGTGKKDWGRKRIELHSGRGKEKGREKVEGRGEGGLTRSLTTRGVYCCHPPLGWCGINNVREVPSFVCGQEEEDDEKMEQKRDKKPSAMQRSCTRCMRELSARDA